MPGNQWAKEGGGLTAILQRFIRSLGLCDSVPGRSFPSLDFRTFASWRYPYLEESHRNFSEIRVCRWEFRTKILVLLGSLHSVFLEHLLHVPNAVQMYADWSRSNARVGRWVHYMLRPNSGLTLDLYREAFSNRAGSLLH